MIVLRPFYLRNPTRRDLKPVRLRPSYRNWRRHKVCRLARLDLILMQLKQSFDEATSGSTELEQHREHVRECRLRRWTAFDAYTHNCSMPLPLLRDISDSMMLNQVWMIYLLPLKNLAFLMYSQLLLIIGISYFLGRI